MPEVDYNTLAKSMKDRVDQSAKANLGTTFDVNPDQRAEYLNVSRETGIPANIVEYDPERAKRTQIDYNRLAKESPALTAWLGQDRDNAAISRDDLEQMGIVEQRRKNVGAMSGISTILNRARGGWDRARMAITATAMTMGVVSQAEAAEQIASLERSIRDRQKLEPASVMMFEQENQRIIKGIDDGLVQTKEIELLWNLLRNPTSFLASSAEAMGTSAPSLITGAAGAVTGSAAGPKGGVAGFIGGTFLGGVPIETGSFLLELLNKEGVDTGDPSALRQAFANEDLMRDVRSRAVRKGVTTAGVDALFAMVGGKFVPTGGTMARRAAGAAVDVGVQMVGEGASEYAGQVAALGLDDASLGEAIFEGLIGGGTAVVQTAIGATVREPSRFIGSRRAAARKKQITEAIEAAGKAEQIMELSESLAETVTADRSPDRVRAFLKAAQEMSENGDTGEIYFQGSEWNEFFTSQGVNPITAAESVGIKPNDLSNATETGGVIRVDLDDFVLGFKGDERLRDLLGIARFSAEGQSVNEAVELLDQQFEQPGPEVELGDRLNDLIGLDLSGVTLTTDSGVISDQVAVRRTVTDIRQNYKAAQSLMDCLS